MMVDVAARTEMESECGGLELRRDRVAAKLAMMRAELAVAL